MESGMDYNVKSVWNMPWPPKVNEREMATSKTVSRLSWYVPLTHICGTLQMLPWSPQLFSIYHHPVSPWQIKRQLQMNKTTDSVPLHLDEIRWGHLSPLLRLFSVRCLIGGKVPISLCMCKISCATSITSVISYAMVICSEWLVGISFATFRWWYPFIFSGSPGQEHGPVVREVSVSVSGPLHAPGIETKEDSCRCLNGPAHMKWLTDTHTAVCWH